jgi:hypothetical protein
MEFWPLKLFSEVLGVHWDSISQSGNCLGSVKVHSFTLSYTYLHSWEYVMWLLGLLFGPHLYNPFALIPGLPLGSQPCNPFYLRRKPKARVATNGMLIEYFHIEFL